MDREGHVGVVGSLNDDTTLRVATLPAPGETVLADGPRRRAPGGKGANQAAAAAVLGARVTMIGAVGRDEPGERAVRALGEVDVDVAPVAHRDDVGTGIAVLTIDAHGENTIVVDPGANATLGADEVTEHLQRVRPDVVLVQLEVPLEAVRAALTAAVAVGARAVLNPAPMPADPTPVRDLLDRVDVLVPNRGELGRLAGRTEPTTGPEVRDAVASLGSPGAVVVTLGADGALCCERGAEPVEVAGVAVDVVDTSGAGDVFCGALARELARGRALLDAVGRAGTAAAASTTRPGARIAADLRIASPGIAAAGERSGR